MRTLPLIAVLVGLWACSDPAGELDATTDAGTPRDASPSDTGRADSGLVADSGGVPDSGSLADGGPQADAAPSDASGDAEVSDLGPGDAADPDAADPDASAPEDSGPACQAGLPCPSNPGNPCRVGVTTCGPSGELCEDGPAAEDGVACTNGLCAAGACLGSTTISVDVNLSTDPVSAGRNCAEAPAYSVLQIVDATLTLTATPSADCLAVGDEVLLINLQGTSAYQGNVGAYELGTVASLGGAQVELVLPVFRDYGDGPGSNGGLGTLVDEQKVSLLRVPHFGQLTIDPGVTVTAAAWDGQLGGVLALRAGGLALEGIIDVAGLGYRGGRWSQDQLCTSNLPTEAGESIGGPGGLGAAANLGGSGGVDALAGLSFNGNTPLMATAGHALAGEPGSNALGRVLGGPGAAYGVGDGSALTMGSGPGGDLTCNALPGTRYVGPFNAGGGIALLLLGDLNLGASAQITATPPANIRDTAPSGGYLRISGHNLQLGDGQVNALGATGVSSNTSGPNSSNQASPGYIALELSGTLTGTTAPPAWVQVR